MRKQAIIHRPRLDTFLKSIPISFSNNATFWLSHVSTPSKSASISWNSSCVIKPAEWNLVWSLYTDPRLVSHFLRAILSGMCVINLNIRASRWWMSNSSSKRRGSSPLVLLKMHKIYYLEVLIQSLCRRSTITLTLFSLLLLSSSSSSSSLYL